MSLYEELKKEHEAKIQRDRCRDRIKKEKEQLQAQKDKEHLQAKNESERIKLKRNKNIKFRDEDFLGIYYYNQSDLSDFAPERIRTLDELTEEEEMDKLRKKKSSKAKPKRKVTTKCKCK